MPEFTGHNDLRSYLRILWRWKLLFIVFVVAGPAAAYLLEHGKPNIYAARALVGINQSTVNTSLLTGGGGFETTNVTAIAQLVTTTPVATLAGQLMHPPASPGAIVGEVSASGDSTTNFLTISAEDRSPARAAEIANAFARAIALNQQNSAVAEIQSSIKGVTKSLSQLGPKDPNRASLQQQLSQLQAALGTQGQEAAVLQSATPSSSPVGPHLRRAVELGLLIGLLAAIALIILAEGADRRMRSPDDLESLTDLPMLAAIAPSAFGAELETTPVDEEAFRTLRTALTYFNVDRRLKSVMITSPGEKEGKTTVATRLALASARLGSNVVLVDADLRRAGVTHRLGIETARGIADVLADQCDVHEVLQRWSLEDTAAGKLTIVPAGHPPPNPSALISSVQMLELLEQLQIEYDLVIVDTPAALAVSDAVPLMRAVSGVVLVARMNRSNRATIQRLRKIIEAAHGTLIGVVATGVTSGPGYEHYSPSYYDPATVKSKRRLRRQQQTESTVVLAPLNADSPATETVPD